MVGMEPWSVSANTFLAPTRTLASWLWCGAKASSVHMERTNLHIFEDAADYNANRASSEV